MPTDSLPSLPLPSGVTSSYIDCRSSCGLTFHILSAGNDKAVSIKKPLILLVHGFPELAFSWRRHIAKLAGKGYYVVAPDQRGYGRTTGWDNRSFNEVDLRQFTYTNLIRDLICLVHALGYTKVHCIIGHDFGAVTSAMAPLMRPDIFTSCIQMSHPHHAPPKPPLDVGESALPPSPSGTSEATVSQNPIVSDLASLTPPRKHYKWYNSTVSAATDWSRPEQGLHDFLRGYFHVKSADWAPNDPHPLSGWTASELGKMPEYYILPLHSTMPQAIASLMKDEDPSATKRWLPDADLDVYVSEWARTGFQGGLNWYRAGTSQSAVHKADLLLFAGRKIEVPTLFVSGEKDWGSFQQPGALEGYEESSADFRGTVFVKGAGHWVQQEQVEKVSEVVLEFLGEVEGRSEGTGGEKTRLV